MSGGDSGGLWLLVAVVVGAVGTAMVVYGMRQKEPMPLVFGVVVGVVPFALGSGWAGCSVSILLVALFFVVRKYW